MSISQQSRRKRRLRKEEERKKNSLCRCGKKIKISGKDIKIKKQRCYTCRKKQNKYAKKKGKFWKENKSEIRTIY